MYTCIADDQGVLMEKLESLEAQWRKLGQQFCIPEKKMDAIAKEHDKTWECLNATVAELLQCNFTDNVKDSKVKPNVDWLIRAVRKINLAHANKLEKGKYQC